MRRRFASNLLLGCLAVLLALVLFPVCSRVDGPRRVDELTSRLHQLWVAASVYQADYGVYPDMHTPATFKSALYPDEIRDASKFLNPHDQTPILCNPSLSGKKPDKLWAPPEQIVLLYGRTGRDDKPFAAINLDGTARPYPLSEWEDARKRSRIPFR